MNKSTLILFVTIAAFSFLQIGCKKESPIVPPVNNPLQLTIEDATCTEVFLKFSLATSEANRTVTLKRGDSSIATITMASSDSLFVDEGLLPKKTYKYTLAANSWSVSAQTTTIDTTSHDWTWQIDTLGIGDSYLYDVAIINDTLAYAVGEIHIKDSSGQYDTRAYNVARWNGKKWELQRVTVRDFGSGTGYYPLYAVYAFNQNDVWFASDADLIQWNGNQFVSKAFFMTSKSFTGQVRKMWGTSANNIYCVGKGGAIYHYTGSSWQKIESGTTVTLNDVWGGSNKWIGNNVALIAASEKYIDNEKKILRISNGKDIDTLPWPMKDRRIHSSWFDQNSPIFTSGGGVFQSKRNGQWKEMSLPLIYTNRIRGNGSNDLVVVGDYGIVGHFNGVTWKVYDALKLPNGNYESVSMKGNLIITAGWYSGRGYLAVGKL